MKFISAVALVCLLALVVSFTTISGGFTFDDDVVFVLNKDINSGTPIWTLFQNDFWGKPLNSRLSTKSYRPLTVLCLR